MIAQPKNSTEDLGLFQRMTSTVNRCHIVGAITATTLIISIGWVLSRNQTEVLQIEIDGTVVNLADARELIDNANQWRQQYTADYTASQEVDELVEPISMWLPRSVDWLSTEQDIRSIATTTATKILAIDQAGQHVGARVGVVTATCTVEGSYQSLCAFLNALTQRPNPIACSEITLHRMAANEPGGPRRAETRCTATLSLRIPFAASGTAAGQLLAKETRNAS